MAIKRQLLEQTALKNRRFVMKCLILKPFPMILTIVILAGVLPFQAPVTSWADIVRRGGTVSHDAPTDPRGCHRGPDGVLHCH
jgi:hypothetical protein